MRKRFMVRSAASFALAMISFFASAMVKPAALFTDHMVLQHDQLLPVWGTAAANEKVVVRIGNQTASATTGVDGKWMLKFPRLKAGGPYTMTIIGENTVTINDVYAGEVWLCSGQSNMDFTVAKEDRYWCGVYNEEEELAKANYPLIRVFDTDFTPSAEPLPDVTGKWELISPATVGHLSAIAYFFAREIQAKINMPIGLITTAYGASTAEAWVRREALAQNPKFEPLLNKFNAKLTTYRSQLADTAAMNKLKRTQEEFRAAQEKAKAEGKPAPSGKAPSLANPVRDQHNPYVLWNGMVQPLVPYAIRGALWYQGESNLNSAGTYAEMMETLIRDWRTQWGQGDFPFYYVQLANISKGVGKTEYVMTPAAGGQDADVRNAQLKNLAIPNTGMVVAIDNANPENMSDVHPKNKQEIARRLALIARANVYGEKKLSFSGPLYDRMKVEGNKIRLHFTHTDGGLIAKDGDLKGFAIAGKDKKYVWGTAKIEGDYVIVSSPEVTEPVAVRYGYASNPPTSLYNKANMLPASPFLTDGL
jgi:sialate O-acetylesterase